MYVSIYSRPSQHELLTEPWTVDYSSPYESIVNPGLQISKPILVHVWLFSLKFQAGRPLALQATTDLTTSCNSYSNKSDFHDDFFSYVNFSHIRLSVCLSVLWLDLFSCEGYGWNTEWYVQLLQNVDAKRIYGCKKAHGQVYSDCGNYANWYVCEKYCKVKPCKCRDQLA